jgi:histidine triad (HIT) family protein
MGCPFCVIYEKKLGILYETENVIVIADRYPLSDSHLLIIPKAHKEFLHLYGEDELSDVLAVTKRLVTKLKLEKYNVLQNNGHIQSVPHVHFHLIPFNSVHDCLRIDWRAKSPSDERYEEIVEELKGKLDSE